MAKLTLYQKRFIKMLIGSVLYTLIMLFGVTSSGFIFRLEMWPGIILLSLSFLSCAGVSLYKIIVGEKTKFSYIYNISDIVFNLALTVFSYFVISSSSFVMVIGIVFAILLIINSVLSMIHNHRARNIAFSVIRIIFALLLGVIFIASFTLEEASDDIVLALIPACLVVASFVNTMVMIFSGLRRKTLLQVMKKTYTIEILYGLVTLVVATAVMLTFWEDSFPTIGDALWYCFAVVTTIGFGDFVATTIVGRLLTVLLGVYGIIVVALITSIIVNFYNETAHQKDEVIIKEVEKLDQERKESEQKEEDK